MDPHEAECGSDVKGCEKMLQLDQIRYELNPVKENLKELGESL